MEHSCDDKCECKKLRLDAAMDSLKLSSSRLKDVIFTGPDEKVDAALAALRFARFRFLEARAEYHEGQATT